VGPTAEAPADVYSVRRDDIRIIVNIPGRCGLASKLGMNGRRREFACRVIHMSARGMALVAPTRGRSASM